jgi:hypothetical protein
MGYCSATHFSALRVWPTFSISRKVRQSLRLGKNRIDLVLYPYPCGEATPLEFRSIYPRFMTTSLNANPKAKICYHKLMLSTTHSLGITLQSKQTCISSLLTGMKSI